MIALASLILDCLLEEKRSPSLMFSPLATFDISSPSETWYLCRLSQSLSALCNISATKSPLPRILASPFSPPALLTRPPPCSSGRFPWSIPFLTNWRYLRRATFLVSPKWRRTSWIVLSAKAFFLTGFTGWSGSCCFFPFRKKGKKRIRLRQRAYFFDFIWLPLLACCYLMPHSWFLTSDLWKQGVSAAT